MNNCSFIGRIGGDAEVRYTGAGKAVTSFSLAIESGWGENKKTTWVNCSLWGRGENAHGLTPYIIKGKQLGVMGSIYLDKWTDRGGSEKFTLKMDVRDVTLCGPKESDSAQNADQGYPEPAEGTRPARPGEPVKVEMGDSDDIPF